MEAEEKAGTAAEAQETEAGAPKELEDAAEALGAIRSAMRATMRDEGTVRLEFPVCIDLAVEGGTGYSELERLLSADGCMYLAAALVRHARRIGPLEGSLPPVEPVEGPSPQEGEEAPQEA